MFCQSQWPCGLRRKSTAACLLRLWVRIPPGSWMFVCCKCCVLSGRGLCDALITRPDESYRLWCVAVCDLETSRMRRSWPTLGHSATKKKPTCFSPVFRLSSGYQIGSFKHGRHLHKVCTSFMRLHSHINNIVDCCDEEKLVKTEALKTRM